MTRTVRKAKFVRIEDCRAMPDDNSIRVLFEGHDGHTYDVELDGALAGTLIGLLANRSAQLAAKRPELADQALPLSIDDLQVATNELGQIAWKLRMKGGGTMVFQFSRDQFEALDARMSDARAFLNRNLQ